MIGRKKMDGLRALDQYQRGGKMADAWLIDAGYAPKEADSILERVTDGRLAECGVSARTGWLMPEGQALLDAELEKVP